MWLLYGIFFMPLVFLIYLYPIGRSYVRAVHGGFKSAIPFVLIYSVANLVLWVGGVGLVGFNMRFEGADSTHVDDGATRSSLLRTKATRTTPVCARLDCATGNVVDDGCTGDGRCTSCVTTCEPALTPTTP